MNTYRRLIAASSLKRAGVLTAADFGAKPTMHVWLPLPRSRP